MINNLLKVALCLGMISGAFCAQSKVNVDNIQSVDDLKQSEYNMAARYLYYDIPEYQYPDLFNNSDTFDIQELFNQLNDFNLDNDFKYNKHGGLHYKNHSKLAGCAEWLSLISNAVENNIKQKN